MAGVLVWIEGNKHYINGHEVTFSKLPKRIQALFNDLGDVWQVRYQANPHYHGSNSKVMLPEQIRMSRVVGKDLDRIVDTKWEYLSIYNEGRDRYYRKWWGLDPLEMCTAKS